MHRRQSHRRATPAPARLVAATAALLVGLMVAPGAPSAVAATTQEPPLTVGTAQISAALHCSGSLPSSPIEPVLFLHGTTSNSAADWSWNWNRAFDQRHWAYCDLDLPESGNGDIQMAAEYVVGAVRTMNARSHRRVALVGHSQGGMIGRWALKYWPDTRGMVADYVGLASSNHGTQVFRAQCAVAVTGCTAANWQQAFGSHFLTALNRGPQTWPGIDYTEIATRTDEVVVPYASTFLPPAANVTDLTVQDLCPAEVVDHFGMSYDNAAWLIGVDALTHAGPADMGRVSRTTCGRPLMPGVDPATFPAHVLAALGQTAASSASAPTLAQEPPLQPYAVNN
ncbi:hypothetical protein SRB17_82090 [Streptomyces sp. RB17]|uniref:esterase/lipase family protein n=1 Tax=Streptomyces sp. RB17 TaxID=2585197 RepID=UPI0012970ECA|nr:alpha/beta fold hydrolase [Streptomyces sp. RB17]MQY40178.1 hypothetical protein [Streptomyces sp. RB17]